MPTHVKASRNSFAKAGLELAFVSILHALLVATTVTCGIRVLTAGMPLCPLVLSSVAAAAPR